MTVDTDKVPEAKFPCFGSEPKTMTVSWSRLSDWMTCRRRVRLIMEGNRSKTQNARNTLAGNVVDYTMRHAIQNAEKDSGGRILSLTKDDLLEPLPDIWNKTTTVLEPGTVLKWNNPVDPVKDQKAILKKVHKAIDNLFPILEKSVVGKRVIPEMRPKDMPPFGIPGPDGETVWIRLFLAVDVAVQIREDPDNPRGLGDWGLYDLKTATTGDYVTKSLPQLVFYDLAFHALTGRRPVEHKLWTPLLDSHVKKVEVTDEHRDMVTGWIIDYCHGVWAGKDELTEDKDNCFFCPTKHACPRFTIPLTKDEQGVPGHYFGLDDNLK